MTWKQYDAIRSLVAAVWSLEDTWPGELSKEELALVAAAEKASDLLDNIAEIDLTEKDQRFDVVEEDARSQWENLNLGSYG